MHESPRIDAHHHFWKIGKYDYPWIEPSSVLDRDYGPAELSPLLVHSGIERTVLVQTIGLLDETRWFLDLAQEHAWIAGVVGWVDLADANVEAILDGLITRYGRLLVGIRHNLHDEPADRWILRDDVGRGLAALATRGLAYDLLIRPRHLRVVLELIHRQPELRLVIDHAAKPAIAERRFDDWAAPLAAVALHEQVFCKLSGLITEADHRNWQPADLRQYVEHVLAAFGPERVMFGSDWPVCLLAGSYERVIAAQKVAIEQLNPSEQAQVFGGTAEEFYKLSKRA
jgi:L-fuconolactonase